jgi:hypothetical protein
MSKQNLTKTPYAELDSNMVGLCKMLNKVKGIHTIGSWGGHEDPGLINVQ